MRLIICSLIFAICSQVTWAAENESYISVPASQFTGTGTSYNGTGTGAYITTKSFAALNLPHESRIVSFTCGGRGSDRVGIRFTLRRNEPQQQNIDLGRFDIPNDSGFHFGRSQVADNYLVNNRTYNYYIVAQPVEQGPALGQCLPLPRDPANLLVPVTECSISACNIRLLLDQVDAPPVNSQ